MVLQLISEGISTGIKNATHAIVVSMPNIIAAIIVLFIGYVVGKVIGEAVKRILEKSHIGKKIEESKALHGMLKILNTKFEGLIGTLISVFFYVVFILAAIDILKIQLLSNFVNQVLLYLPNLIAGIFVLIIGLIAVEWIMSFIHNATKEYKIDNANMILTFFRAVLTLVIIVITLDQWKINTSVIYTFIQPFAWGIAIAIAIAFGWGFKDVVAKWANEKSFVKNKK